MEFSAKIFLNNTFLPQTQGLVHPPRLENPGSTTVSAKMDVICVDFSQEIFENEAIWKHLPNNYNDLQI